MLRFIVSTVPMLAALFSTGAALAQTPVPPMPAGWITIARSGGCKAWNPAPHGTSSVTWTGDCAGGQASGHGTLQWMVSGNPSDRYEGEMYKGKYFGNGVLQYGDGRRYEGSFRDGQRTGRGTLTYPNGMRYVGDWKNDRPHGKGTLTAGTDTYSGGWIDGCFKEGSQKAWLNKTPKECGFE